MPFIPVGRSVPSKELKVTKNIKLVESEDGSELYFVFDTPAGEQIVLDSAGNIKAGDINVARTLGIDNMRVEWDKALSELNFVEDITGQDPRVLFTIAADRVAVPNGVFEIDDARITWDAVAGRLKFDKVDANGKVTPIFRADDKGVLYAKTLSTALNSLQFGGLHKLGSNGENVTFTNLRSGVHYNAVWQAYDPATDEYSGPVKRVYGDLQSATIGTADLANSADYDFVVNVSQSTAFYSVVFIPAESYIGDLTWIVEDRATRKEISRFVYASGASANSPSTIRFNPPLEISPGSYSVRIEREDGEILLARPDKTTGVVARTQTFRTWEDIDVNHPEFVPNSTSNTSGLSYSYSPTDITYLAHEAFLPYTSSVSLTDATTRKWTPANVGDYVDRKFPAYFNSISLTSSTYRRFTTANVSNVAERTVQALPVFSQSSHGNTENNTILRPTPQTLDRFMQWYLPEFERTPTNAMAGSQKPWQLNSGDIDYIISQQRPKFVKTSANAVTTSESIRSFSVPDLHYATAIKFPVSSTVGQTDTVSRLWRASDIRDFNKRWIDGYAPDFDPSVEPATVTERRSFSPSGVLDIVQNSMGRGLLNFPTGLNVPYIQYIDPFNTGNQRVGTWVSHNAQGGGALNHSPIDKTKPCYVALHLTSGNDFTFLLGIFYRDADEFEVGVAEGHLTGAQIAAASSTALKKYGSARFSKTFRPDGNLNDYVFQTRGIDNPSTDVTFWFKASPPYAAGVANPTFNARATVLSDFPFMRVGRQNVNTAIVTSLEANQATVARKLTSDTETLLKGSTKFTGAVDLSGASTIDVDPGKLQRIQSFWAYTGTSDTAARLKTFSSPPSWANSILVTVQWYGCYSVFSIPFNPVTPGKYVFTTGSETFTSNEDLYYIRFSLSSANLLVEEFGYRRGGTYYDRRSYSSYGFDASWSSHIV